LELGIWVATRSLAPLLGGYFGEMLGNRERNGSKEGMYGWIMEWRRKVRVNE